MAGPVAGDVRLPDDASNTGKRIRTQSRVIGGNTVHEHFFVPASRREVLGRYYFVTTLQSVQVSAQNGTTTGFFWLFMPVGATQRGRIRRIEIQQLNLQATTADLTTVPRLMLARFTFTGTASGAAFTPCLRKSDDASAAGSMRTASTGLTVSLGAAAWSALVAQVGLNTSGIDSVLFQSRFEPTDEEDFLDFDAGQGFVLYQPDAGSTGDTRRFIVTGEWDEYDDT